MLVALLPEEAKDGKTVILTDPALLALGWAGVHVARGVIVRSATLPVPQPWNARIPRSRTPHYAQSSAA